MFLARFLDTRPWLDVDFWALDLETSGLRPERDVICSVGMVPIRQGSIRWGERQVWLVNQPRDRAMNPQAIAIHQILPQELAHGLALHDVYAEVLRCTANHVLLVHHKALDWAFLRAAAKHTGLPALQIPVVDTIVMLQRLNQKRAWLHQPQLPYNLGAARRALSLPAIEQHDALADALACAELFLLVRHKLGAATLREML
jgi:DNA polymerase-3 subunit epsilon